MTRFLLVPLLLIGAALSGDRARAEPSSTPIQSPAREIDALIDERLLELGVEPNEPVDDATFLRRVYLDLAGRIPTIDEAERFYAQGAEVRRGGIIEWLTSKRNPTFTRVIANRLWKKIFGAGLFEPLDEITDNTPIHDPKLMAYLEQLMRDLDYDMKAYLAILCTTPTARSSASWRNGRGFLNFPRRHRAAIFSGTSVSPTAR